VREAANLAIRRAFLVQEQRLKQENGDEGEGDADNAEMSTADGKDSSSSVSTATPMDTSDSNANKTKLGMPAHDKLGANPLHPSRLGN